MTSVTKGNFREKVVWGIFLCCALIIVIFYWDYIMTAKSTVPIMDFWHWIKVYGEKAYNGTISFRDYFFSDEGQHIQPLAMAVQFGVLASNDFDVQPLVTWGMALRILVAVSVALLFIRYFRKQGSTMTLLTGLTAVAVMACVLNYNQWEMTTEPFSFGNSIRVGAYYISFFWSADFAANMMKRKQKKNILCALLLGAFCSFLTIFVGSAYFVGHLTAMGVSLLCSYIGRSEELRKHILPLAMWAVVSFAGALIYLGLYILGRHNSVSVAFEITKLVSVFEGIVLFWAGAVLPERLSSLVGFGVFYISGTVLAVYSVVLIIRYIRAKKQWSNIFPLVCLVYAWVISAAIAWGRVETYGVETMCSSRYAVESSIGLVGLVWMNYDLHMSEHRYERLKGILFGMVLLVLLGISAWSESDNAPYRGMYSESIKEIMYNIDDCSDEELSITQGCAEDVRYCVNFFKENKLSIFSETYMETSANK